MNDEQTALSWLAVIALIIGVWLVYRPTLSAIIFGVSTPNAEGPLTILPGTPSGTVGVTPGTSDVPPGYGGTSPFSTPGQGVPPGHGLA